MNKTKILNGLSMYRQTQNQETFENFIPRPQTVNFTIPVSDWTLNNEKYYADINITGVTTNDYAEIDFASASEEVVANAKVFNYGDSMAGKLRIYAADIPTAPINASYVVWKG